MTIDVILSPCELAHETARVCSEGIECEQRGYCDGCFGKYGPSTKINEEYVTRRIAEKTPSLESVTWRSWFTPHSEGHSLVDVHRRSNGTVSGVQRRKDREEEGW